MGTQGAGRKRSSKKDKTTAEDDALNLIAREAEARLAAKRAARAEAREIRMKELERQQKEAEDRDYLEKGSRAASALTATTLTSLGGTSSRRGSGETSLTVDAETSIREIKEIHELKDQIQDVEIKYTQNLKEAKDTLSEVEEKYRKAMVSNAQLDNEKNNYMYQVDTLKDSLMELEELLSESNRGYEEKVKDFEREKHAHGVLQFQFSEMKETLKQSEELLNEIRQLRLKQDGFVREISDLQETVEWKDKKIGALERQKEYTDAIRTERDELREEAVKLKDILKKHGIVLGPDLSVNGDIGEADADGSSSGDAAHQPAPDSQTAEGNSMLGNTEETEEVDPDQHPDILKEEAKENQLSSDKLCDAAVSTVETSAAAEEQPTDEQQTVDESIGGSDLSKDLNVDIPDHPVTEGKDITVTSAEGNSPDTETTTGEAGSVETETDFKQTCDELSENKQEAAVESDLRSKESCPQQTDVKDISRDVENDEAEEVTSKSQGAAASGKRRRKKKRGKKKGNQQKEETEKENSKTEASVEPDKKDKRSTTEPDIDDSEILKESKVEKEQVGKQTEEVEAAKSVEPTETVSLKESSTEPFTEPREDHVTNEQDKEQTETIQEIKEAAPSKTLSCTETPEEIRVSPVTSEQNKDQSETAELIEVVAPTESFSQSETPKELCREPREDEQSGEEPEKAGTVEPCPPETHLSACDLTDPSNSTESTDGPDRKFTDSVDESELSANDHIVHPESKIIDNAEDEEVDEMKPECKTEGNTEGEPHVPSSIDVAADVSESTNIQEGVDLTSVSSPDSDDVTICLKSSSDSEPQPEPSSLREESPIEVPGEDPEETTETLKDVEEAETEQECFPLGVTAPELKPDEIETEPDNKDNRSTTEPEIDDSEILKESKMDQVEKEQVGQQTEEVEAAKSVEPTETVSLKESSTEPREDHVTNEQDKEQTETIQDVEEAGTETEQECCPLGVTAPEREPDEMEELDRDGKEPGGFIEPESSSRDENGDGASSMTNPDALDTEKSPLETEAPVEHLDDVENQTSECVELKDESDSENLNTPESQKESSCSPAELLHESSKDKSEEDPSPPKQQGGDEEEGEDEEGQSFDFDDIDVEAAFETNQIEDEEIEEGVEAASDPSENTQSELTERNDEASKFDERDQVESETAREARRSTEEGEVLNVGESSGVVAEDVHPATSFPAEEGLVKPELQGDSPVHVASDKEPPHSGKGVRKNSKKGKGKGKEESPLTISLVLPTPEIRLRKLVDEREKMIEQVKKLKAQLEQKSPKNGTDSGSSPDGEVLENGNDPNILEVQRDSSRQMSDLKFKLVKAEQEVTALEQNVTRLEGQVTRYKSAAENAEKVEDELKAEKRKLQRELRSSLDKVEELESSNSHLSKRMEKMKSTRGMAQTP